MNPAELRELAHLRRRWAASMERHIPQRDSSLVRLARRWVTELRREAQEADTAAEEARDAA